MSVSTCIFLYLPGYDGDMGERKRDNWVQFGNLLKYFRNERTLSGKELARQVSCAASLISKLERAVRTPDERLTRAMDKALKADGKLVEEWEKARKADVCSSIPWQAQVLLSEADATSAQMWAPLTIPGVFQTKEYATVIFTEGRPTEPADSIREFVQARLDRAQDWLGDPTRDLRAIIDETALYRRVGGPQVMASQLRHLHRLASGRSRVTVLPAERDYTGGLSGPFRVLQYRDGITRVYAEHTAGGQIVTDPGVVHRIKTVWRELQAWTLTPKESLTAIEKALTVMEA